MKSLFITPHYSLRILLHASVLLLVGAGAPRAHAAGEYQVDNVVVDAGGKDTLDARAKALQQGEKDAFAQLILRRDSAHAAKILAQVTPSQVAAAVHSFKVADEKMTSDHYHAALTYSFDPGRINALAPAALSPLPAAAPAELPAPGPPVSPQPAAMPSPAAPVRKAVLVLPVYRRADNALELWQDDNAWRGAWYNAALEAGGGLVVVPLGNLADRIDVDDANVEAATSDSLKDIYDRYGVGDVLVMQAFFDEKADPKPTLQVTLKRLSAPKAPPVQMSYIIHAGETLEELLARAGSDIAKKLYQQQTVDPGKIEAGRLKEITARINTNSIQEWQALRSRLLMRTNIVDVKFVSISYYETTMIILFKGSPDTLGKTLVASGLRVMQDGDRLVLSLK